LYLPTFTHLPITHFYFRNNPNERDSLEVERQVQQDNTTIVSVEADLRAVSDYNFVMKKVKSGKMKGKEMKHYYCIKSFQGPSSGTALDGR
jgi:hypothetical protein